LTWRSSYGREELLQERMHDHPLWRRKWRKERRIEASFMIDQHDEQWEGMHGRTLGSNEDDRILLMHDHEERVTIIACWCGG
jgi:hypothetical protein